MNLHFDLIDNAEELQEVCLQLEKERIIAFDTEFIRETTFTPKLGLIQIATQHDAWLVDVLSLSKSQMEPLFKVLQKASILKVLHSAYGDQECLYHAYGITASPSLDTFEAASLLGFGESIGLRDLVHQVLEIKIAKDHTRTDWLKRPLNYDMKKYALSDVQYLVKVAERLLEQLESLKRKDWALKLSSYYEDPALYEDASQEIAKRLSRSGKINAKNYGILKALVAWRESRARALDIPRRRIADDGVLIDIANAKPKNLEQLSKFRGINKGEIERQGRQILEIIESYQHEHDPDFAQLPKPIRPTAQQSRMVDLLGTYLRILSEDLKIAATQLLTSKELQRIVVEDLQDPSQWVEAGLCSSHVAELVGEELRALLQGKRGLAIQKNRVKILKL